MTMINTSKFAKTGGLTEQELLVFKKINYDLIADQDFEQEHVQICNAIHLIQAVFMARSMIRLSEEKFWIKYNLPYERNFPLNKPPKNLKYKKIIEDYLQFYSEFQKLEPYHPYHLDDISRGINQLFAILSKSVCSSLK